MPRRSVIRASDGEREAVAERLRTAAAEGRLLASELEHRLSLALRARTLGELDGLVADLPGTRGRSRRPPAPLTPVRVVGYAAAAVLVVSVLAVAAVIVAGLLFAWAAWAIIAFWMFGRRRPLPGRRFVVAARAGRPPLRAARRGLL